MKLFTFLIVVIVAFKVECYAQNIYPEFESTSDKIDSTVLKKLVRNSLGENDVAISLTATCPWFDTLSSKIIVRKNGYWEQYDILFRKIFDMEDIITINAKTVDQNKCEEVFMNLIENNLFTINTDSLIKHEIQTSDSTFESFSVCDGVDYTFIIMTKNKQRVIFCPSPETYYNWMPDGIERKYFIVCKDLYVRLWDE